MLSIWDPFTLQEGWGTGDLDSYVYLFYNQLHKSFSTFPVSLVMRNRILSHKRGRGFGDWHLMMRSNVLT